jgi:N-acylglucosamine 2-epimerase
VSVLDFSATIKRYEDELLLGVIPFWEKNGVDEKFGGYFTFLDATGSVYDTEKFMWMQWRIVYMFATLSQTSYGKPQWLEIAKKGYDFLVRHGKDEQGHYYFSLNREGVPSSAAHSIYSECFAAMGASALYKACQEEKYRIEAESAMNHYIARMANPKGKWNKALSGKKSRHSFGHYMILANLGQVLSENLGTDQFDGKVAEAVAFALGKFWNPEYGMLFENIDLDGSFDMGSCEGRLVNPGHGLEAMWFILQYAEKSGQKETALKAAQIIKNILRSSWDETHGGIFYFLDALGKPPLALEWDMKLWWVHNEALIATLYAYFLTGDEEFLDWFKKIDQWTWKHFPDKENGEWYGYLSRNGEPSLALKGGKWKTFFHLPRCLLVCVELMKKIQTKA